MNQVQIGFGARVGKLESNGIALQKKRDV